MKKVGNNPHVFNSISELHKELALTKPKHPLISVINFEEIKCFDNDSLSRVSYEFYCIALKKNFEGKMKYGQQYYDFDEGVMTFFSPMQVVTTEIVEGLKLKGYWLVVHPTFLVGYSLMKSIKDYGFFSYSVNEALHLSEQEEEIIENIFKNIEREYQSNIDQFSQSVIIAQIELLLQYCNRFYNRQFITRKIYNDEILIRLENILSSYFNDEKEIGTKTPSVKYVSEQLNLSANYLSDMLRSITGQTTQQHIHNKLIEKAKELLTSTNLTISEIAFQLGFVHPQSFNKLFKKKTDVTPMEFRKSFN
ncbi:AraC family transcriptional regulator [Flavobacterium sp. 9AF]|uniref:helix-turn-helix domain-containing protein n=1 Tax=Flavobacterium sp. 9AF TaxID=2653142 RepID=UPI0012F08952|nr:helix-turn-helix transcriptional regulator [Flavobacterium sp. 9AF]VXA92123.1 AraC family transcriptional regulator [Flavobacterium sp. 9AF]